MVRLFIFIGILVGAAFLPVEAPGRALNKSQELADLSLEELMGMEVTTVSRKPEALMEAAAAIYVITGEDIRRSGATTIPEALRLAPGVTAGQVDANNWAVSVRGFNGQFANKLLVLIDGRSVYSPMFSGVFWDSRDVMLEDVDRIEVIRGPGAALWGANAVNGVLNIITKNSKDTQGGVIRAGTGTEERVGMQARYSGVLGEAFYRVYTKFFQRDGTIDSLGRDVSDDWQAVRTGFRVDWAASATDRLTFQGDWFDGEVGQAVHQAPGSL
ncbi:MAG: TonB-dependent receptor plug domain-containing protein, partial [bacterium]|nr:TonB-dependent receptor plug domain-containing protein [bacterium]